MDHQSDVHHESLQGQHQRLQEQHQQQNIVYIQQNPQHYRNQNHYPYINETSSGITGNQSFQNQNASFGQFDNNYSFVTNGHFPSSNASTTLISDSLDGNKVKNVQLPVKTPQYYTENDGETTDGHQGGELPIQFASGNFQSVDLQSLNYQQASPYYLQNIGNHYQLNDNIVPMYQSSGSSESSDESSASNVSQIQYSSDSGGISSNQFDFPVPVTTNNQIGQNLQQLHQKDFLDNYMALVHQEAQLPRCDSSKSETAESTCSSLSSASSESQSESENVLRLPLIVNPIMSDNANILQSYQSNIQNTISSYANSIDQNVSNEFQKLYSQNNQGLLKYSNLNGTVNQNVTNENVANNINNTNNNNNNNNNMQLNHDNQVNNLLVMVPNRMNNKNNENCLQTNVNQQILQNPSSQEVLNSSKFIIQNSNNNQKSNQQKIYSLINVANPMMHPIQVNQMIKLNSESSNQEICNQSNSACSIQNNTSAFGMCSNEEDGSDNSNKHNCGNITTNPVSLDHHTTSEVTDACTSHIQNTSDSSVINSNFVQNNAMSVINGIESERSSAMLLKETSDKSISQSVSDVNSSVVNSNSVYLIKNDENNVIKSDSFTDSSSKTCFNVSSGINLVPVPAGWRRLLVDGSIIYLSPTNVALSSIDQVKMYLQTTGTCKCGLECPVNCDSVFNFNPKVISRPWDLSDSEQTRLCNHKRKAPLPPGLSIPGADQNIKLSRKEIIPTKRKTKKNGSSGSGVSVSQLLAQRDRALAAATAGGTRWPTPSIRPGLVGVGYQNVVAAPGPGGNQFQNVHVVRQQAPVRSNAVHCTEAFVRDVAPARGPDDKVASFPCINVINREGTVLNLNEMSQLLPESMDSTGDDLIRSSQLNSLGTTRQEPSQGVVNNSVDFGQCAQEFIQNNVITSKPEGVLLGSQEMMFPSNMVMQRPRTIPPWHQTKLGHNKKPTVPETPVIYEKVPFVQQPMAPPAIGFDDVANRKKAKPPAKIKKASHEPTQPTSSQPSFMDNPSAYLAQQTALLHNTISRPNFNLLPDTQSVTELPQNLQNPLYTSANLSQGIQDNIVSVVAPTSASVSSRSVTFSVRPSSGQKFDQNNLTQVQSCHQVDGKSELTSCTTKNNTLGNHVCSNTNCADCKKTVLLNSNNKENLMKAGWRENGLPNTLRREEENCSMDDNPVTSSTEKVAFGNYSQKIIADTRPIQGGTVSTSNGSPQPQPSPNSSNVFRQEVSSSKHSESQGSTIQISSTNSFLATSNSYGTKSGQENDVGLRQLHLNGLSEKNGAAVLQALQSFDCKTPTVEDQKQNFVNCNLLNVTTSSSDSVVESNSSGDLRKAQSVTSSLDDEKNHPEGEVKVNRYVRTMASSNTASSNTITSVQAGKTQTTTVTVSNSPTVPSTAMSLFNLSNQSLLNVQVTQKGSNKSPLEMVQSVVSSIHSSGEGKNDLSTNMIPVTKSLSQTTTQPLSGILTSTANVTTSILAGSNASTASVLKTSPGTLQAGHILVSSNGQYLVAANGNIMPQTNLGGLKLNQTTSMPPMSASPVVTNVTGAMTQVLPAVGVAQQVLGQSTVLVNAVPAPFVIQPGVMAVDTGLGRLAVATGNVLQGSVLENNALRNSVRGVIPTEKIKYKKGTKKRKNPMTSLVQMASPNNVILNQPFGQQNFTVSPGGSVQPLQALTLVQGKHGQIVMNNQNNFNQFNSQPQQINLLQPVNLTSVQNFPAFQQFIVPGLGNMVMATDGTTTILPETTNIGVQLQLQNVNGQNVLTPVQNTSFLNGPGILTTPTGMFIRAPSSQQKIIQNNASPQFLSPNNGQFLVNQFQGQLSPIIAANLSPNQQIFATSPQRQSPQEFIQIIPTSSSQNTTVVQQNTTIVQQQTTMVSNSQNLLNNNSRKSNFILSNCNSDKPIEVQIVNTSQRQSQANPTVTNSQVQSSHQQPQSRRLLLQEKVDFGTQHSVSTQTNVSEEQGTNGVSTNNTFCQTLTSNWNGSPPDTTTHSPVESVSTYERVQSPAEEGADSLRQAMVQYVSSSINENEGETDGYLIPGMSKSLEALSRTNTKGKNVVESSTILQETGVQIQIGNSYLSSDHLKSAVDECIVSSHSDVGIHEKHMGESQSNVSSYQKDKIRLVDALLAETKSDDLDDEGLTEAKEKFREGDLVWGPVRGSPAWPGKLVGPVGPGGKALVRWFGGHSSPTKVNVSQLQSLSQGLEAHHRASNKGRKNRRLNAELEAAIQEAMLELDRMTTQGKKTSTGRGRPRRLNR